MAPDDSPELDPKVAELVQKAVAEVRAEFLRKLEQTRERLERLVHAPEGAAEEEVTDEGAPATEIEPTPAPEIISHVGLRDSVAAIDRGRTQTEILGALVEAGTDFASRAALFLTRADGLECWATAGFGEAEDAIKGHFVEYGEGSPWTVLAEGRGGVELDADHCRELFAGLEVTAAESGVLVPLVLRDRLAAALYAERIEGAAEADLAALQVLTYVAAQALETLPLRSRSFTATLRKAEDAPDSESGLPLWESPEAEPPVQAPAEPAIDAPIEEAIGDDSAGIAAAAMGAAAAVEAALPEEEALEESAVEPEVGDEPDEIPSDESLAEEITETSLETEPEGWEVEATEPEGWEVEAAEVEAAEVEVAEVEAAEVEAAEIEAAAEEEAELQPEVSVTKEEPLETTAEEVPDRESAELEAVTAEDTGFDMEVIPSDMETIPAPELDGPDPYEDEAASPDAEPGDFPSEPSPWPISGETIPFDESLLDEGDEETLSAETTEEEEAAAGGDDEPGEESEIDAGDHVEETTFEEPTFERVTTDGFTEAEETPSEMEPATAVETAVPTPPPADSTQPMSVPVTGIPGSDAQVRPPEDVDGPGWAFSAAGAAAEGTPEARQEEARRLARLLVTEIKLYNEEQVAEGRQRGNVYGLLRDDIDRSRLIFEERVDEEVRQGADYFHEELVRILAGGNAEILGD